MNGREPEGQKQNKKQRQREQNIHLVIFDTRKR